MGTLNLVVRYKRSIQCPWDNVNNPSAWPLAGKIEVAQSALEPLQLPIKPVDILLCVTCLRVLLNISSF